MIGRMAGFVGSMMIGTIALSAQTITLVVRGSLEPEGITPIVRVVPSDGDTIPCVPDRALPDAMCLAKIAVGVDAFRVVVGAPGLATRSRNFSQLPVVNDTVSVRLPPMQLKELGLVQSLSTLVVRSTLAPPVVTLRLQSRRKETVHVRQVSLAAYEAAEALPSESCLESTSFYFEPSLTVEIVPPGPHALTEVVLRQDQLPLGAEGHALRNCHGRRGIRLDIPASFDLRFSPTADGAEIRVAMPVYLRRLRPGDNSLSRGACTHLELATREGMGQCFNVTTFKSFALRLDATEDWVGHIVGCVTEKAPTGCESYRRHPLMKY